MMKKLMMVVGGCLLAAGVAQAEVVEFRDYDAVTGTFMDDRRECTLVTDATWTLEDGWYAVKGEVTITAGANLTVKGTAHLILCDGAKLSVEKPTWDAVAVRTTGATLVIYGQTAGTGQLAVTGCDNGAGIGGCSQAAGGTVIINGGTVTATGGASAAGIGGGTEGAGGTVTINGGSVTATGGERGAGIGGGLHGAGGKVTITGGTVTANGGLAGAGIGGGYQGDGGSVMINGGTVTATGGINGADIGGGYQGEGGTVTISGGNVKAKIPSQPKNGKGDNVYCVTVEGLGSLEGLKNYGMRDICPIAGMGYLWLPNGKHKWLSVNGQRRVANVRGSATTAGVLLDGVTYCDAEGNQFTTNDVERIFQNMERTIGDGAWYAVDGVVDMETLFVSGEANIILMDGAKLTATGFELLAGIEVAVGNTLNIWGQVCGDGELMATGGMNGAGIGGDYNAGSRFTAPGGTVIINGGTVTVTGGASAAGIGGGFEGAGGTVIINGGTVTATGGTLGAGIGGGAEGGAGGTVTINGGTVTAKGGYGSAGIGGGLKGEGGTVTIDGGAVCAEGWDDAEDIGHGEVSSQSGTISVSGGIFWKQPEDNWLVPDRVAVENPDETTRDKYPWMVIPTVCVVTVGSHPSMSAAWTSGDGSVTNTVEGETFSVSGGARNVKVIFAAKPGYVLTGEPVVDIGTVTADVKFGSGGDYKVPSSRLAPVKYVDADGEVREKANGEFTRVSSSTKKLADGKWYAVIDDVTLANPLTVEGTAHLILCDWASLTVTNAPNNTAAISVGDGASLAIYGQTENTGRLEARGGAFAAGIGGVMNGDCGAITIRGGTVKAQGGNYGAGIGSGTAGKGGSVTITGGCIWARAGSESASDIGDGYNAATSCAVSISGGIFARELKGEWLVEGYEAVANPDAATKADYPWAVVQYPGIWPDADDAVKARFAAWRNGVGSDADLATDVAKDAFLLNVAVDKVKELKIESIEVDDNGYAVIVVGAPGAFFFDRVDLGEINGILYIEAGETLETMTPKSVAYWTTTNDKAMIKVKENFIRAAIGFKSPKEVADTVQPEQKD